MKKFLAVGILAIGLIAMSQNQASAWVKWNIGVGANLGWSSGGNSLLWGAWNNSQPPGQEIYGQHGQHQPGFYQAPHYTPYTLDQSYVQPTQVAPSVNRTPYHTATYPRPVYYYYSTPYYYGR